MDDEEEVVMQPGMQQGPVQQMRPQLPPMVRAAALMMTGEFVLIVGILFVLLGMGAFVTDFLHVKGSGEILVGLFLCGLAFALVMVSNSQMPKAQPIQPQAQAPPQPKAKKREDSGIYR